MLDQYSSPLHHDFMRWMRHARSACDLTQEALAEQVGCATATIRSLETGRRRPSREMAARLADVLQIPATEREQFIWLARSIHPDAAAHPAPADPISNWQPIETPPDHKRPVLPTPTNALIGRQDELRRLTHLLLAQQHDIVTLLGPGGIGKTRLALQAALDLEAQFADGAVFIWLVSFGTVDQAIMAIAEQVGCSLQGTVDPAQALVAFLQTQSLLLVLDNLEHLLVAEHAARMSDLIAQMTTAPRLRILITSRERLRLRNEHVVELDGLVLPAPNQPTAIVRSAAVLLFVERARQIASDFALTIANRDAIVQICHILGGLPLGIELAASWVRVLNCQEIAAELVHNRDLLALSDRDLPPRHRSLRAVIDHSWQLLTDAEQQLLTQIAVFRGGADREAIGAVVVIAAESETATQPALLPLLAALVDKSLVRRTGNAHGITRYDLHELVRQYAAERLAQHPGLAAAVQSRHAGYYTAWLTRQEAMLKSPEQKTALHSISIEFQNIRVTWEWACDHYDAVMLRNMALALNWFFEVRGWSVEGIALFTPARDRLRPLAERPDAPLAMQVAYWSLVMFAAWNIMRQNPVWAVQQLSTALDHLRHLHDPEVLVHNLVGSAYIITFAGDYASAQALLDEATTVATAHGYRWGLSVVAFVRSALVMLRDEPATARTTLHVLLAVCRGVGDPRHVGLVLANLGATALVLGELDDAERLCRESLAMALHNQDRYQTSVALQVLGHVALARQEYIESAWMFREALHTARAMNDRWQEAQALGGLGLLAQTQGDVAEARIHHRAAVATAADAPPPIALDELAALALLERAEQPVAAHVALAYLCQHPLTRPATRARIEQHWQALTASCAERAAATERASAYAAEHPSALLALFAT